MTGLIGPNGAGKTTTFNACTGLLKPTHGRVAIAGADVSRRGPSARARTGLGRTFQKMELFETLTVRENVEAGAEGVLAGANPITHVVSKPGQRAPCRSGRRERDDAMRDRRSGRHGRSRGCRPASGGWSSSPAASPARSVCCSSTSPPRDLTPPRPRGSARSSSGSSPSAGVGILLVEHDMSLVLDICEHIYVLDFGELIFEGTAAGGRRLAGRQGRVPRRHRGRGRRTSRPHDRGDGVTGPDDATAVPVAVATPQRRASSSCAGSPPATGRTTVLRDVDLDRRRGPGGRAARPQRRRQDHPPAGRRRSAVPSAGRSWLVARPHP